MLSRMRALARITVSLLMLMLGLSAAVQATNVRALSLPGGFTIRPEADNRVMTLAPDGTVFAIAQSTDRREHRIAVRWRESGKPRVFKPLNVHGRPLQGDMLFPETVVADNFDHGFVTVGQNFDGAYSGTWYEVERWSASTSTRWKLPSCVDSSMDAHAFAMDARGRIALTLDASSSAARTDPNNLPVAVVVDGGRCTNLGSAILTSINGINAAGYLGYLNQRPAAWFINRIAQRLVALRWMNGREQNLGAGVPFAITDKGFTVGATALPGHAGEEVYGNFFGPPGRYEFPAPHAVAWLTNGNAVRLTSGDARSVAWDVAEDETVVGTEQMPNGKRYAFRVRHGRLERLDDLPHPPGWRFESAYAIGRDGSIVGIGSYRGTPTAFVWHE